MPDPTHDEPPESGDNEPSDDFLEAYALEVRPPLEWYYEQYQQAFIGASASCDCEPIPVLGGDIGDAD